MGILRNTVMSAVVGASIALTAGSASAADWIMASGYPDSNFHTQNIQTFIEEVEASTSLKIQLNSNDTLIKLDAIKTALQRGQIPIGEIRLGVYGNEDPMYVLAGLPFIAADYTEAWLLKDLQKEYFDKIFAEQGLRILYYSPWPGQGFYTKFPVTSVEDFSGKKLRIYSTATQEMGQMLGFDATILPFAEIPQAFSTGLIEALFTSPQTGIDIQAWDNTSNFTYAGAIFSKNAVVVNESFFSALPVEEQMAILKAAEKAELRGWEMSAQTTAAQMKTLAENGMTTASAPPAVIEKMKTIGLKMMETWRKDASPEAAAILDRYLALQ
ncbi:MULTISPECIES: TRAP transporter substrate-binding protein [Thalassobaculum]|uniref:TRAP-type C4-dicarboxylate transport system, substrate-binding protein n=1 Tax=Thalassobaculum litoreum DSM 18839 TaxID=1123362 RepID=A0A8G2BH70_9PROT|nr:MULTISPECIES: TRAP transporter substrate-binding protein [Thalassobaculum]SDF67406.1 TRAP-type C4-dicarboxylate transport system, substrate-binding protein [Thalassobaculum litoreum DSM 18839]